MTWWASLSKHGTTRPSQVRTAPCHMRQHASSKALRNVHCPVIGSRSYRRCAAALVSRGCPSRGSSSWAVLTSTSSTPHALAVARSSAARVRWVPPRGTAKRRAARDPVAFGLHHGLGALHHFGQRATDAVGRVRLLGQSVDGDDEAAEPSLDEGLTFGLGQVMGVGGRGAVDAVPMGALGNESVELGVKQGLALKVQVHVGQPRREFVQSIGSRGPCSACPWGV